MPDNKDNFGQIILLTGISGSGKTTLGLALYEMFLKVGQKPVEFIDGDSVRQFLEIKSGFAPEERATITKQMAYGAYLLAENGVDVIMANIAGKYSTRDFLRRKWKNYIQVFLDADINDCIANDSKGIYKEALRLDEPQLYGLDLPYQKPRSPDIVVYPYKESVEMSLEKIVAYLKSKGLLIANNNEVFKK